MIKIGRSFWWILLLAGIAFLFSQLPGFEENPIYARLTVALVLVMVVNGVWSAFALMGLGVQRSSQVTRKQVGEIFAEKFEIINHSRLPKGWMKITDQAEFAGHSASRVLTWVWGDQARQYIAYSQLDKRGWFKLGPTLIETGDLFGLFLCRKVFPSMGRLLVIPYMVEIAAFPLPFGVLPGGRALRQKTLEVTPYAGSVREYVPGDTLRRIHWPTSVRKQKLIVKEFEKDPLAEVWIFLDAQESVHVCRDEALDNNSELLWVRQKKEFRLPPETAEYTISIAASVAKYYIRQSREVGLVSAGQAYSILPAERGERQLGKILETLAVLQAEGEMPLWGLISSQLGRLTRGSTIILITPSTDENILIMVMDVLERGLMPVVILIDQASFGGDQKAPDLEKRLIGQGILVFVVYEGDDLKTVLETPKFSFNKRFIIRRGY